MAWALENRKCRGAMKSWKSSKMQPERHQRAIKSPDRLRHIGAISILSLCISAFPHEHARSILVTESSRRAASYRLSRRRQHFVDVFLQIRFPYFIGVSGCARADAKQ